MLLKGRTAVVTGCNRGIGRAILELFVESGANVFACTRKPTKNFSTYVDDLARTTNTWIQPVYFDLSDLEAVKSGAKEIIGKKLPIDILVNNAGSISTSPFQLTPVQQASDLYNINFLSPIVLTQYVVRLMTRNNSGNIINISSSAAIEGNEGRLSYAASKAALLSSTTVIARELAQFNIRANAIAPGLTETDMMVESTSEKALKETLENTMMQRVGSPQEIAQVVLFLASDMSSYMTGQVLRVDGGM